MRERERGKGEEEAPEKGKEKDDGGRVREEGRR